MTQSELIETLETFVDQESLATVVTALHLLCFEKAEHLRDNWQDETTAKVWDKAAAALYKAATNSFVVTV